MPHRQSPDATRPHACPVPGCQRRFKRRFTLKEHVKTHTGEKPFVCPVPSCRKGFTTSGNLSRHKRLHPWLDAPYECLIVGCGCTFPSEVKLQRHMTMVHFGASTHLCPVPNCGGAFSTAGNLRRHIKQHHPDVEVPEIVLLPKKPSYEPKSNNMNEARSIQSPVMVEEYAYDRPEANHYRIMHAVPQLPPLQSTQMLGSNDVELLEALGCLFDADAYHHNSAPRSYIV